MKEAERHLVVEYNCAPEMADQVRELLMQNVKTARAERDCLYYDLYQGLESPGQFFVLDGWRDPAALDAHRQHSDIVRVRGLLQPLLNKATRLSINQRLTDPA